PSDGSLAPLRECRSLTWLSFIDCKLDEGDYDVLCSLKGLEDLNLENCDTTDNRLSRLERSLPNCEIDSFEDEGKGASASTRESIRDMLTDAELIESVTSPHGDISKNMQAALRRGREQAKERASSDKPPSNETNRLEDDN